MTTYTAAIKHAMAIGALCCLQVTSAGATVAEATLSLSGPTTVFVGEPFTIGVDLQLPEGSAPGGVSFFTAQIFYFPGNTPTDFAGHTPLVLNDIVRGPLLNSPTDYFFSPNVAGNPYLGDIQAAAYFLGSGTMITAPTSGRLMNLEFGVALGADGVGSAQPITVAISLYDGSYLPIALEPATTSVTILQPTIAVPEASTAVLIAGGLLLLVFGRRKLKFSPQH